jgi:mutator protein MutT
MPSTEKDMDIIQKIVVGGAVFNKEGKLLILQRVADEEAYPNLWELPGGSREPLEPCEATLVRELKEEAGIDVRPIEVFSSFNYTVQKPDLIRDTTQIGYIAQLLSDPEVTISPEHQAYAWISEDEMGNYKITEETQKVIHAAFKRSRQSK